MHLYVMNAGAGLSIVKALVCLFVVIDFAIALRDVRVQIPHAVRRGEKAILQCLYNLEDDTLYSVKWYKGRREFYSFTPKENPAMKVYQFTGVKVDRSTSNESQLVLDTVNLATTGKYSCEVSADAPSFHTLISAGELEVVEVPGKDPIITGIRPRYRVGDIVRGNCTARHSKPAANLTWTINGYETNPSHVRHHKPLKDTRELETAISGIHFVVTPQHFLYGKLKIRCTAYIHDVYWKSTEKSIEEDRHNRHNNVVGSFSEDYFDLEDGNLVDRSDTYLTHIKGDASSLNAGGIASMQHSCIPIWPRLTTFAMLLYAIQQILQLCRQLLRALRNEMPRKRNDDSDSDSVDGDGVGDVQLRATANETEMKTITKPLGTTVIKAKDREVNDESDRDNNHNDNASVGLAEGQSNEQLAETRQTQMKWQLSTGTRHVDSTCTNAPAIPTTILAILIVIATETITTASLRHKTPLNPTEEEQVVEEGTKKKYKKNGKNFLIKTLLQQRQQFLSVTTDAAHQVSPTAPTITTLSSAMPFTGQSCILVSTTATATATTMS